MTEYDPLPKRPQRRQRAGHSDDLPTRPVHPTEPLPPTQIHQEPVSVYAPADHRRAARRFPVALIVAAGGVFAALLVVGGLVLLWLLYSSTTTEEHIVTATPLTPVSDVAGSTGTDGGTAAALEPGLITLDASGNYAFPVAADPAWYGWTHTHWDDTNAVDIEARFDLSYPEFLRATNVQLVAATHGVVYEWSGSVGGNGYILQGDDGFDYYYAHMASLWLDDGARVSPGDPLGVMGNTGGTAQFIEPHLHFAIGPRDTLQQNVPLSINSAEWLWSKFGLAWEDRTVHEVPPSQPQGWPVQHPQIAIVTPYAQSTQAGLPQPGIELGFTGAAPEGPLDVVATLTGEVNVIRWTEEYGTRIQITNEATQVTVVISGVDEWTVRDGDLVTAGQVIGRWLPTRTPRLNLMLYRSSELQDPTPTLGG